MQKKVSVVAVAADVATFGVAMLRKITTKNLHISVSVSAGDGIMMHTIDTFDECGSINFWDAFCLSLLQLIPRQHKMRLSFGSRQRGGAMFEYFCLQSPTCHQLAWSQHVLKDSRSKPFKTMKINSWPSVSLQGRGRERGRGRGRGRGRVTRRTIKGNWTSANFIFKQQLSP